MSWTTDSSSWAPLQISEPAKSMPGPQEGLTISVWKMTGNLELVYGKSRVWGGRELSGYVSYVMSLQDLIFFHRVYGIPQGLAPKAAISSKACKFQNSRPHLEVGNPPLITRILLQINSTQDYTASLLRLSNLVPICNKIKKGSEENSLQKCLYLKQRKGQLF